MEQTDKTLSFSKRSVAGYILLPRVIPRVRDLFASGFATISYLIALVYGMVRLLPPEHPYLNPRNKGEFGIRHVVAAAADNLVIKKENFDQIIIFFAILAGIALLFLQIIAVIYGFLFAPAAAQFLNTAFPENDIAFTLMDRVFGVPRLFCNAAGACTSVQVDLPFPFHTALHSLLQFYSMGILLVGVIIFLYYIVIVVGETAISGTPFGQRFANIWVPIRLVVALGLLVPLNYGLNSAQYITLVAAKYGSGLATNGWNNFNAAIADRATEDSTSATPLGESESLVAKPQTPDSTPILQFMNLVQACAFSHWIEHGRGTLPEPPNMGYPIKPYFVKLPNPLAADQNSRAIVTTYEDGLKFYNNGDIVIRFGTYRENDPEGYKGEVEPTCGEIRIHTGEVENKGQNAGPNYIQNVYFNIIMNLWKNEGRHRLAKWYVADLMKGRGDINPCEYVLEALTYTMPNGEKRTIPRGDCENPPPAEYKQALIHEYNSQLKSAVTTAWNNYRKDEDNFAYQEELMRRGWGGAGIWYNNIARINGAFAGSVFKIPSVGQDGMPLVMQKVRDAVEEGNTMPGPIKMYSTELAKTKAYDEMTDSDKRVAENLYQVLVYWTGDSPNSGDNEDVLSGNPFIDAMHIIFGTKGLFEMRGQNIDVHPLAQLSGVGKSLVDSAVLGIAGSTVFAFGGGVLQSMSYNKIASLMQIASSAMSSIAFIGLTAGFLLYYILPFMPFLYFFFAVGTWLKTIFEAMVGVPLWALAHLRLDGEGLPGEAASTGYYLILEIFLRPIIIVFGLIAAMVIFTTQARALNYIWDLVISNLTGHEDTDVVLLPGISGLESYTIDRGIIDEFFYTIIFTIIIYMMANASFKLIDTIPKGIMRWISFSSATFGDFAGDKALDQVNQYAAISGQQLSSQLSQGLNQGAGGIGGKVGEMFKGSGPPKPPPPPKP